MCMCVIVISVIDRCQDTAMDAIWSEERRKEKMQIIYLSLCFIFTIIKLLGTNCNDNWLVSCYMKSGGSGLKTKPAEQRLGPGVSPLMSVAPRPDRCDYTQTQTYSEFDSV